MYIETRTTADEVLADVVAELRRNCFSVINDANTRRIHPTYITKPMLRENLASLSGAHSLAAQVLGGYDRVPPEVQELLMQARRDVAAVLAQ